MKHRVVVVDDSAFIRRVLTDWLKDQPDFDVVGTAENGNQAVAMVRDLRPDIVTLDTCMPVCDGLTALQTIMCEWPTPVLIVSEDVGDGIDKTMEALELGALDVLHKPHGSHSIQFLRTKEEFLHKMRALASAQLPPPRKQQTRATPVSFSTDKIVLIAASTGGPAALSTIIAGLPEGFPAPIVVVQQMPEGFTASLAKRLTLSGTLTVREAQNGDKPEAGVVLIAPTGKNCSFDLNGRISLTEAPVSQGMSPSADLLFTTASRIFGKRCVAIVLTGMGRDGAVGSLKILDAGGTVFGECESTCAIYGMSRAAKEIGAVTLELPVNEMAGALSDHLSAKFRAAG